MHNTNQQRKVLYHGSARVLNRVAAVMIHDQTNYRHCIGHLTYSEAALVNEQDFYKVPPTVGRDILRNKRKEKKKQIKKRSQRLTPRPTNRKKQNIKK
jgi:phosphatidate phosphatase APP1